MGKNSCHEKQCVFHHRSHFFPFHVKKLSFHLKNISPKAKVAPGLVTSMLMVSPSWT